MTVGVPLGLVALVALPALVAAYLLRRRSPPRTVSAAFLWRATEEVVESGPQLRRLRREASLLLELAAALCATAFLADVRCASRAEDGRQAVLVLDGTLSMRAHGADGRTFAERARTRAKALVAAASAVTVVETGAHPRLLAGPAASPEEALVALERWVPSQAAHPFSPAWVLARELAGGAPVQFLTDGLPEEPPPKDVALEALGEPRPNLAFTAALRTDTASGTRLRLRVTNDADTATSAVLEVRDPQGTVLHTRTLSLEPGATEAVVVQLPRTGQVEVVLPDDALPDDSHLLLWPDPAPALWVKNALDPATPTGAAVARFLAAAPDVHVGEPSVLTFEPPAASVPPWTVTVGATGDAAGLRTFVGPFFTDRRSPLLDDVGLDGVLWTAGANPPGAPLVTAGDRVLLSEEPGPRFHLNLELSRSNVQRTQAWPVLLANLVDLRRGALPGFSQRNLPLGTRIPLDVEHGGRWTLEGPAFERALAAGAQDVGPLAPGRYLLRRDGEERDHLSVLALDAGESDLRWRTSATREATNATEVLATQRPARSLLPVLLMLALLLADFTLAAPGSRRAFSREPT